MVKYSLPLVPVERLYGITAVVPILHLRLETLRLVLLFGVPTILGFMYATKQLIENWHTAEEWSGFGMIRLSLLVFASSWFAWFAFLSAGRPRYFLPPLFLGSVFVAALFRDLYVRVIGGGSDSETPSAVRIRTYTRALYLLLITTTAAVILSSSFRLPYELADPSLQQAVQFLNTSTPPQAIIETYDTEVQFLLNRRYHYPPDQVHVELMYKLRLDRAGKEHDVRIDYDPLAADPDYLVVGPFMKVWRLYEPILMTKAFRHRQSFGGYDIYQRVR